MQFGDTHDRPDGAPFNEKPNDTLYLLRLRVHPIQVLVPWFRVGLETLAATIALLAFPGLAEFRAFSPAFLAIHFGLPFLRSKPIIASVVGIAANSACRLALFSVAAEGGAFLFSTILIVQQSLAVCQQYSSSHFRFFC